MQTTTEQNTNATANEQPNTTDNTTEHTPAPRRMANQLDKYRPGYQPGINAAGHKTKTTGDELALFLLALDPARVVATAEIVLGLARGELAAKYDRLNPGQRRMNSGNRIRNALRKGNITMDEIVAAARQAG